jgi:hypothetical protein
MAALVLWFGTTSKQEKLMKMRVAVVGLLVLWFAGWSSAQDDKSKRPSPPASAECKFSDGKTIKVDYSSPRARGRKIFGGVVPYGEVWRTGANEATTFVNSADVTIGGKTVPAGNYTMFTIPNQDKWTLIISKKTGEWGIPYPEGEDLVRADMSAGKTDKPVENFTISFHEMGKACHMYMDWENTRATVEITEK